MPFNFNPSQYQSTNDVEQLEQTSRKPGSVQVGISKAQKSSRNIFFKSRTMPKNLKRGHLGSLNVFRKRKLQKNARGYPLMEFDNFRKKVA